MSRLNGFLSGIRVLDLSLYLPGPLAGLLLADMGAEVLKVEPPAGDPVEELGPRDGAGRGAFYQAVNAGKTAVRLNLKDAAGRARLLDLAREADVLLEGFRPGVMARLGAGYEALAAINPRLIYCSLSGHGATGPLAQKAGHDGNYLAEVGILHRNGAADPVFFDPPIADGCGGLFATIAILGALQGRVRSGRGCHLDLGLADAAMPLQLFALAGFGATGHSPPPESYYLNGGSACYRVYRLGDGRHVMLGAIEAKFWHRFCTLAGRPDWIGRQWDEAAQPALRAEVAAFFAALTQQECERRFGDADVCLSPVRDLGEALRSAQVRERGLVRAGPDGAPQALFPALVDGEAPAPRPPLARSDPDEAQAAFVATQPQSV